MANENPTLTITLTGRPPVRINKAAWPIVASAQDSEFDNQHECQANRQASWKLLVRQHDDGRTIVYAIHTYTTHYQGESGRDVRGGELITVPDVTTDCVGDTAPIVAAIYRVAAAIEARMPDCDWSGGVFPVLAHECVADLPAVEI